MIDDLAMTLSPYSQRPDQEVALKPLLPPVHPSGSRAGAKTPDTPPGSPPPPPPPPAPSTSPPSGGRHPAPTPHAGPSSAAWPAPIGDSGSDHGAAEYPQAAVHALSRESFERNNPLQPAQPPLSNGSSPWQFSQSGLDASEYSPSPAGRSNVKPLAAGAGFSAIGPDRVGRENAMMIPGVGQFEMQDTNYEGSYW